jgi:hypothetical protein
MQRKTKQNPGVIVFLCIVFIGNGEMTEYMVHTDQPTCNMCGGFTIASDGTDQFWTLLKNIKRGLV